MHLKSVMLRGFKSFADKTHLIFEPGITVIVGPNGSGKSNITDAVLWALGEQSPRSLRGSSMEDVIFTGSSTRSPLGVAEVYVCLDNSSGQIPIEFSEAIISRRVFRSGESEYRINDSPCRLLEIQELLANTGIGRAMYSIVSQGKLEEVLTSRSEERRALIDEAAGVLKYRKRKEKALRKIALVEQNLLRIKDIQREVNHQLRPLRQQADQAQTYNQLADELKNLEINLAVIELKELQSHWEAQISRESDVTSKITALKEALQEQVKKTRSLQAELEKRDSFSDDLQSRKTQLESFRDKLTGSKLLLEEKSRNLTENIEKVEVEESELKAKQGDKIGELSRIQKERTEVVKELEHLAGQLSASQERLNILGKDLAEINKQLEESRTNITKWQNEVSFKDKERISLQSLLSDANNKLSLLKDLEQNSLARRQEIEKQLAVKEREKHYFSRELERLAKALDDCDYNCSQAAEIKSLRDRFCNQLGMEVEFLRSRLVQRDEKNQLIQARKKKITDELTKTEARIANLKSEESYLGQQIKILEDKIGKAEEIKIGLLEEEKEIEKQLNQFQIKIASLTERQNHLEKIAEGIETTRSELENSLWQRASVFSSLSGRLAKVDLLCQLCNRLQKKVEVKISQLENSFQDGKVAFGDIRELIGQSLAQEQDYNKQAWDLQEKLHQAELSKAQLELKVTTAVQKIVDEYNLPLERALENYPQEMAKEEIISQIKKLRSQIIALGPINPIAIEEHRVLEERYLLLTSQSEDLLKSKKMLREIIGEIDRKIESAFLDTFQEVNKHFQSVFSFLFNGGKAELVLTDPDDLLQTGIEIEVYPDGKKLQKLSLLSGGERALTALALIFGIYYTRPSPFYILDEVEAALDDVNLQRFVSLLDEMKQNTQFLIITHQKRTMEMADCLYGVSMQADGVSKLVSQKMN